TIAATSSTTSVTQAITASSKSVAYKSKPFSLNAKSSGGGKLTYKTSNKKVATVSSSGTVTVKNYGQTTITITAAANGNYQAATKKITIKVVPKKVTLKSLKTTKKKTMAAKWTKDKTVTGYQVYFSNRKDFKKGTFERTYKASKSSMSLYGVKSKKTYYVKIRAYKKVGSKKYYGSWSNVKKVKIK
ncbi:MAG: Ig-like domain-containing protein, partial [Lachnospiraceae bacterium]|nr:Ig-like domain-containing protein [Lachnospiraceae bacterium]